VGAYPRPGARVAKNGKTHALIERIRSAGKALEPRERFVLVMIAQRIGWSKKPGRPPGTCNPSIETIAEDTGYHVHTVEASLRVLRSAGWLQVTPEFHDGKQLCNRYRITPPEDRT